MKLPTKFRILGHDVLVERVSSQFAIVDKMGECDSDLGTICVKAGMEPSIEEATVLHEVVHFIDHVLGTELEENQVSGLAQGLYQFFSENNFDVRKGK
jgi:hypothetical protein